MCSGGQCRREALPVDAAVDAFACTPITAGAGRLNAPRVTAPIIDGDVGDWTACFVTLSPATNPARDLDGTMRFLNGRFSVAHDGTRLYIAADVEGIAPLGDQPLPSVYENNSISLYLDGDGSFASMQYDPDAVQIVIDHANRVQAYRNGALVTIPGVVTAVKTVGTRFAIEVAIQASAFGRTAMASSMGFDIGFEGGDGVDQYSEVYWYQACGLPACGCSLTNAAPYCDAREFGRASLSP